MKPILFVVAAAILAGGCSSDDPAPVKDEASSEEILKRNCADPKWREENLGLWYSVCRQPVQFW